MPLGQKKEHLVHHFCCLFAFPLQWHKLMVSGKKVLASDSGSIPNHPWCSQIFWLSDSHLKCSSVLKNDSGNGIVSFHTCHLQIISISDVLCEQWKRHLILFLSVSPCEHNLNSKFTLDSFPLWLPATKPSMDQFKSSVTIASLTSMNWTSLPSLNPCVFCSFTQVTAAY